MILVTTICLAGLTIAGGLCLVRLVRGESLADRIVAVEALLLVSVSGIAVDAVRTGSTAFLDALVVTALIGFISQITVARFIEKRGAR